MAVKVSDLSMKVVHIGFQYGLNNIGGAAIAATRLHLALLKSGIESHYVCVHQREDGPNVHVLPQGCIDRLVYSVLTKLTRCLWKFTPYHQSICLNIIPMFGLDRLLKKIKPDIVHVQWINADVCSLGQLAKLPYKLVFNLHDLYMINAIEPYPHGDVRYQVGFTIANSTMLERWLLRRKRKLVEMKRPAFIGPSDWVCKMCEASIVGQGCTAVAILNIIDAQFRFEPTQYVRHKKMIMSFGAFGGRKNRLKGWTDCEKALRLLPAEIKRDVTIHIFGEVNDDYDIDGLSVHFLGERASPDVLRKIYNSADVFLFPSVEETQGMTKVEALLCGLPVIAFDRTACAEGVVHGKTGWVAEDGDFLGFAEGILHYYALFKRNEMIALRADIAKLAAISFSSKRIVDQVRRVYKSI